MSQYTPKFITYTLTTYDNFVRQALSDGDMERVAQKEEEIVSCYYSETIILH